MKAVVSSFNQEKALVGAFSVITSLRMELFQALLIMTLFTMMMIATQDEGPGRAGVAGAGDGEPGGGGGGVSSGQGEPSNLVIIEKS